jgi:hypothetical protein
MSSAATREAWRAVACYVVGPWRYARDEHIWLLATGDGFATPVVGGSRIVVRGDQLTVEPGGATTITTVRAAAELAGVELSEHPPVGDDLPPFEPDRPLEIDPESATTIASWWALGRDVLATMGEPKLWPEHFDIAITDDGVNIGFSPGDSYLDEPYLYVGPHDVASLDRDDPYWNAPFGAAVAHRQIDGPAEALAFIRDGVERLS